MVIVTVVGARPQFIKAAVVSREIRRRSGVREVMVHTGQHYDENMSGVFFKELDLPVPDYHLEIGSGPHGQQTGRMLEAIERVLQQIKPDWVLVYGDTNSTLAGAVAAAKLHILVAHVEAGLRSFNRAMPEEVNRILTDHVSDRLFTPTRAAAANLQREGIPDRRIFVVGDVMYDAALFCGAGETQAAALLSGLGADAGRYVLATIHRAENTDDGGRLEAIFEGLIAVAESRRVVLPLHPRTRRALEGRGLLERVEKHLQVVAPLGYLDMLRLEKNAAVVATDSGGVQKEAYFFRVPCVTLRGETEWTELVEAGWNSLVFPTNAAAVAAGVNRAFGDRPVEAPEFYGRGDAGTRILDHILATGKPQ